ncbi:nucleotidyltransferase domain-containing protein [bacterium]|nr:nucleotidyltransferase domain-containing protein [bacterium]
MAAISTNVMKSINDFLTVLKNDLCIKAAYLYGSYGKGNAGSWSDIDLAIISDDFSLDICMEHTRLLVLAASIDDRLEPRPYRSSEFQISDPLVNEIVETGIRID